VPPPIPAGTTPGFWGLNPETVHLVVLRLNPLNRSRVAYSIRVPRHSTCVSAVLDRPSAKSSWAPLNSHIRRLDSVNTVTPMYTCTCRCPRCQPPRLVTRPPGPSVQASRPSFTAPGPSARHVPTWPSPCRRPPPPSSTPAHHKPRDMLHNPTHAMVSSQTQPKTRVTLTITHHKSEPQGHISIIPVFADKRFDFPHNTWRVVCLQGLNWLSSEIWFSCHTHFPLAKIRCPWNEMNWPLLHSSVFSLHWWGEAPLF